MKATTAKVLSVTSAAVMIATGLGLTHLLFPHQSVLLDHLEAALGQLLGLAGLFAVAWCMESGAEPEHEDAPLAHDVPPEDAHPLTS